MTRGIVIKPSDTEHLLHVVSDGECVDLSGRRLERDGETISEKRFPHKQTAERRQAE